MREQIESAAAGFDIYSARNPDYETGQAIPFRVSPSPLILSQNQRNQLDRIGEDVTSYMFAVDQLYRADERVKTLLDTGKPDIFKETTTPSSSYLFIRPDIIMTSAGFSICEIETSPFGLALAEILNRGYRSSGFETLVSDDVLLRHVAQSTRSSGDIVYSAKTASYAGQLGFLAANIFSGQNRNWQAKCIEDNNTATNRDIYRAFYLSEYLIDGKVGGLLTSVQKSHMSISPSSTPHMEEKALMALIWDKQFKDYFVNELGLPSVSHLRELIPPTWVIGREADFEPGLPGNITNSLGVAALSTSRRKYVLKQSGFHSQASWSEGVKLLHKMSRAKVEEALKNAIDDKDSLYVIQEFKKATEIPMFWDDSDGIRKLMNARIRLTPYYGMVGEMVGKLIAAKATGCENTDYIHAGSGSINTAVC